MEPQIPTSLYILDDEHNVVPVPVAEVGRWATWLGNHDNRRVAYIRIPPPLDLVVSTVFLGIDRNLGQFLALFLFNPHSNPDPTHLAEARAAYKPILFETMVFHSTGIRCTAYHDLDLEQHYHTYDEAIACHNMLVEELTALNPNST